MFYIKTQNFMFYCDKYVSHLIMLWYEILSIVSYYNVDLMLLLRFLDLNTKPIKYYPATQVF